MPMRYAIGGWREKVKGGNLGTAFTTMPIRYSGHRPAAERKAKHTMMEMVRDVVLGADDVVDWSFFETHCKKWDHKAIVEAVDYKPTIIFCLTVAPHFHPRPVFYATHRCELAAQSRPCWQTCPEITSRQVLVVAKHRSARKSKRRTC